MIQFAELIVKRQRKHNFKESPATPDISRVDMLKVLGVVLDFDLSFKTGADPFYRVYFESERL